MSHIRPLYVRPLPSTMRSMSLTTVDHTTDSGTTRAGTVPVKRSLTTIYADGRAVDTIIWNRPLLRRLDREGISREDYVASRVAVHQV